MKKLLSMLLVVAMLCGMLCGCYYCMPVEAEEINSSYMCKAYLEVIQEKNREMTYEFGGVAAYVYDIDKNGMPELIINSKTLPSTSDIYVYGYNGDLYYLGEYPGGRVNFYKNDGNGFLVSYTMDGMGTMKCISVENSEIYCSAEWEICGFGDVEQYEILDGVNNNYQSVKYAIEKYLPVNSNNIIDYEENNIPIDCFDQTEDSLESWFTWLPMDTYNKQTYHEALKSDFARTFHELIIPFDVGVVSERETQKVVSNNNLPNGLCKVYYLNEIQQTFNATYSTNIDMASLDGLTIDGQVLVKIIDNYFVVIQSPHGTVVNPNPKNGCKIGLNSEYWVWYYQDEWNTNDLIYTIISYKNVAGYDIRTINYIGYELPSEELLSQYRGDTTEITVALNYYDTENSKEIYFDQPPIIKDDRTLVPMRAIFEAMGCDVYWDGDLEQVDVYKDGDNIMTLWIDEYEMWTESGEYITLDVPPQILNDRTLVPVRAISESMGAKVDWDGDLKLVDIQYYPPYSGTTTSEYYYKNQSDIVNFGCILNDNPYWAGEDEYCCYYYSYDENSDIDYCIEEYLNAMESEGFDVDFIKSEGGSDFYKITGYGYEIWLINDYLLEHIQIEIK